jgi:hypothetical protein
MRGYLPGSSPIPVYNFLTGGVLPAPGGCGCKGSCGKCSKTPRGWKRYNEIVTKRLGPGRYSILLKPGLSGLGQDDSGDVLNFFGAPDPNAPNFGLTPGVSAPSVTYPAAPSSGFAYDPTGISGNPVAMPPTTQSYQVSDSGVIPVLNNPSLAYLSTGAVIPTTALSASWEWWLLGGAALVGVVALMSGGKRRR